MPPTASDIAKHLGVSRQSVSKVLLGGKANIRVGKDLEHRIRRTADEMGYRPNEAARVISTGRTRSIDLLMSELAGSSRLSPSLVRGVHEELILADMQLTVSRLPDRQLTDSSYVPKILRAHSADGILINYTHHVPDDLPKLLDKHNIPAVWINTRRGKHCVYADEEQAFDRATQHLIDLGHRRIAYYVSSLAGHFSETDRQTGYVRAMRRAGLTPQVHHAGAAEHADPIHDDRQRRAVNFLRNPNRPTAVLGYSTVDAVVLTVAAAACGLTLGRELSLVGLGDEEGSITGASMTQIVIQQDRIGAAAVRRLLRLIETPSEASPDRLLEADFFIGGSTGPPSPSR